MLLIRSNPLGLLTSARRLPGCIIKWTRSAEGFKVIGFRWRCCVSFTSDIIGSSVVTVLVYKHVTQSLESLCEHRNVPLSRAIRTSTLSHNCRSRLYEFKNAVIRTYNVSTYSSPSTTVHVTCCSVKCFL